MTSNVVSGRPDLRRESSILAIILGVGLVHALLYVFLMPPWQHYDEPNHFEIVWLTAKLGRHPRPDEYSRPMSRKVVQSMIDNGFYAGFESLPDLSPGIEVRIPGYTQYEEQPLYYFLASLPLRIYQPFNIDNQLYMARLASVLLYLSSILAGWGAVRTLTNPGSPLRWMVPTTMVLMPGFTDLMTAVNNDVLAVAAFSFFFWGAARLLKRGYTFFDFGWVVAAIALVYYSKNTAYAAFLLLPMVMIVGVNPRRLRGYAWLAILLAGFATIALSLRWDDAAYWHRSTAMLEPIRQKSDQAVHGEHILALDAWEKTNPSWTPPTYQLLPIEVGRDLSNKEVTFGFWIWADLPVEVRSPTLGSPQMSLLQTINIEETPRFFAMQGKMPEQTNRVWVLLRPQPGGEKHIRVFYDGFVLVEGLRPLDAEPIFSAPDGSQGEWGGKSFTNLLRNGSVEESWPRVEPHLDNLAARILPDKARPTLILNSFLDLPAAGILYRITVPYLLRTFWGQFGWGHVRMIWQEVYTIITWVCVGGLTGAAIGAIRRWRNPPWDWIWLTLYASLFIWFANLVRGVGYFTSGDLYIPPARYSFPAIVPTLTILCAGLLEIYYLSRSGMNRAFRNMVRQPETHPGFPSILATSAYLIALLCLAGISLATILEYYKNV